MRGTFTRMTTGLVRPLTVLFMTLSFLGCAGGAQFIKPTLNQNVTGVGIGSANKVEAAKAKAMTQARLMAAQQMEPDAVEFRFASTENHAVITLIFNGEVNGVSADTARRLTDRAVIVTAHGTRSPEALAAIGAVKVVEATAMVEDQDMDRAYLRAYNKAMRQAVHRYIKATYLHSSDYVFKGTITIASMKVEASLDGVTVTVQVAVSVTSKKEESSKERAEILYASWREAAANKQAHLSEYEELFAEVVALNPKASYYFEYGNYLISITRYKDALSAIEKAVQYDPKNIRYLETLKNLYGQLGMDDKADAINERIEKYSGAAEGSEWQHDYDQRSTHMVIEGEEKKPAPPHKAVSPAEEDEEDAPDEVPTVEYESD